MSLLRWLGVAFLTLAATSALHAQTSALSILCLTALFGQERQGQEAPQIAGASFEEAEELPAPRRCDINVLPAFVPEFLKCWKEQWSLGNYREARLLANIACRLDPANLFAQHALALSDIMQGLTENKVNGPYTPFGQVNSPFTGIKAITGLTPAGTLTPDLGVLLNERNVDICVPCSGVKAASSIPKAALATDASVREIERRLNQPISLTCNRAPLQQVIADLRTLTGVNIIVDRAALQEADISLDMPLSLPGCNIPLKTALKILLDQTKLTYVVTDQVLLITTREKAKGRMHMVTYPVADLVTLAHSETRQAASNPASTSRATPQPSGSNEDILITLIQNTVAPNTWKDLGGNGTMQYFPLGMALVVHQTQDVQEDIAALLQTLRSLEDLEKNCLVRQTGAGCKSCTTVANTVTSAACSACADAKACKACCQEAGCCAAATARQTVVTQNSSACPGCAHGAPSEAGAVWVQYPTTQRPTYKVNQVFVGPTLVVLDADSDKEYRDIPVQVQELQGGLFPFGAGFNTDAGIVSGLYHNERTFYPMPVPRPVTGPAVAVSPYDFRAPPYAAQPVPPPMVLRLDPGMLPNMHYPASVQPRQYVQCIGTDGANEVTAVAQPPAMAPQPAGPRRVHVVTQEFEAHCDRLTCPRNSDNSWILEGDVQLTCNRNGQVMRIQGQRVVMSDGNFTVDSMAEAPPSQPSTRVRVPALQRSAVQPAAYYAPFTPGESARPVRPVHAAPTYEQFKPED